MAIGSIKNLVSFDGVWGCIALLKTIADRKQKHAIFFWHSRMLLAL